MPVFVYKGIPKDQQKAIIDTHMAPLMNDYGPHPRFGGFPVDSHGNPSMFYPSDRDKKQQEDEKEKNRNRYRKERLKELKEGAAKADESMSLYGIEFPNGKPVEIKESPKTKRMIAKLRALHMMFDEVEAKAEEPKTEDAKRGPGRPPKAKDD